MKKTLFTLFTCATALNKNWSENVIFAASEISEPRDLLEVIRTVKKASKEGRRVKVAGTKHSFNDIADTDGV